MISLCYGSLLAANNRKYPQITANNPARRELMGVGAYQQASTFPFNSVPPSLDGYTPRRRISAPRSLLSHPSHHHDLCHHSHHHPHHLHHLDPQKQHSHISTLTAITNHHHHHHSSRRHIDCIWIIHQTPESPPFLEQISVLSSVRSKPIREKSKAVDSQRALRSSSN